MNEPGIITLIYTVILVLRNSATNAQQGTQPQMSCNGCCQGPAGTPGIPGVPGSNGIPGNIGPKGESGGSVKGDAGPRGENGDIGSVGLRGERGLRGAPGKIGPMGIAGPLGSLGVPGVKGQKGEIGQSQLSAFSVVRSTSQLSAFSVVRSTSFTPSSAGQALPFEQVHTNFGDDFDTASGQFTCETPGIYLFTYNIATYPSDPLVCLFKNDDKINCVYRHTQSKMEVSTNTAILQLSPGERVWIWCRDSGKEIYSNAHQYTTFSGVLLHEL
ncbi:uncharacterized protein [Amphiura filiformis]|uniref:uncharacterized protein n=1 Tax=Amphiura filiformis TaxID=82378 RepID=UPI003B21363B